MAASAACFVAAFALFHPMSRAAAFGPPESPSAQAGVVNPDARVAACCPIDFNCDGIVDQTDWPPFALSYDLLICTDPLMPNNCGADLTLDGFVDDLDFVLFVDAYFQYFCP